MEQAKCWESILELISQLDRIQSAACIQGSHDKGFKRFRRFIPTTRDNSPNLMKIHSPFRVISFPLNDLLDSKMRDNGVIINHHETCLIWPLTISDTNFNSKFDISRGFQFDVFLMALLRQWERAPFDSAPFWMCPYWYRFLTETCGLKILKSESGKTFGISNKSTLKIASPADNRWSSMHHFDMTPWRNKRSRLELLVKILVKALVWNIPGSGRSVRQSCLSSFERISIFFLNWVTLSKPIDSADMIYRFTDEPFSILEFYSFRTFWML